MPRNPPSKIQAIRFKKKGKYKHFFKKQFKNAPVSNAPLTSTAQYLLQAAINAGYGSQNSERVDVTVQEWAEFGNFLRLRMEMMLALLQGGSLPLTCGTVHQLLEKTELLPMSNLLGSIFCRIASESWVSSLNQQKGILHFWHWKIMRNPAVELTALENRSGMAKVLNPDFVFETSTGWYTAEAKGSFSSDPQVWTELRWGLQQAAKFEKIAIYDVKTGQTVEKDISGFTCTMAYFDENQHLQVTHLDPPSARPSTDTSAAATVVKEFIYLVRFEQALDQFELLSIPDYTLPPTVSRSTLIDWQLMYGDADSDSAVFLGKPYLMHGVEASVSLALRALRILMPLVGDRAAFGSAHSAREKHVLEADVRSLRRTWLLEARKTNDSTERTFWTGLARITKLPIERQGPEVFWKDLLKRSVATPLLDNLNMVAKFSIIDLANYVSELFANVTLYASVATRRLQNIDNPLDRFEILATENGLVLATRQWLMLEPAENLPRLKL